MADDGRTCQLCALPAHDGDYLLAAVAGEEPATPRAWLCIRCVAALGREVAEARFAEAARRRWPGEALVVREVATWRTGGA